jgi:hypothetical protein
MESTYLKIIKSSPSLKKLKRQKFREPKKVFVGSLEYDDGTSEIVFIASSMEKFIELAERFVNEHPEFEDEFGLEQIELNCLE